jgi:hypothetical protein
LLSEIRKKFSYICWADRKTLQHRRSLRVSYDRYFLGFLIIDPDFEI